MDLPSPSAVDHQEIPHSIDSHSEIFDSLSWESIAAFSVPLLKEIPFNFRLAFNDCWVFVLSWILKDRQNLSAWKCLFLLPSLLLRKHISNHLNQPAISLNSLLRLRFLNFKNGNLIFLS
jgi:hypothetical protein